MIDRVRRWLGGPSVDAIGPPVAAVTLPLGDVLVFDRAGRVLEQATELPESVRGSVAEALGAGGRFFRIIGETRADGWVGWNSSSEGISGGLVWENQIEVEFTAIECTAETWLKGVLEGQPAGRASFAVDRKRPFVVSPGDIWALIHEAVARSAR